jgi:hypothetical protein
MVSQSGRALSNMLQQQIIHVPLTAISINSTILKAFHIHLHLLVQSCKRASMSDNVDRLLTTICHMVLFKNINGSQRLAGKR